jgi:hypothetical protein
MHNLFTNYSVPPTLRAILKTRTLVRDNQFVRIPGRSEILFRELRPAVAVMESENGHSNASQSGAGQRFFAPGARIHAVSPSSSLKGINVQAARKRGLRRLTAT